MNQPPSASSGGAAPLSLVQRFFGVLTSPKATFENVVSWPRWFWMFVVVAVLFAAAHAIFGFSEVGQRIAVDQAMAWGAPREAAEANARTAPYFGWIFVLIGTLVMFLLQALILLGVFAIAGGTASFKQVLAVVVHSSVVGAVLEPVHLAISYFLETDQRMTSLAGIGRAIQEKGLIAYFFAAIDLSYFLGFVVLAIGLGVLYRRRTAPIFLGLTAVYLVIAIIIAVVRNAFFGGS